MEAPEVHTPHAHPSGKGWLDMALGGSAFIISLVSLWLGIQHGRAMEKLVAANSWPNRVWGSQRRAARRAQTRRITGFPRHR